MRLSISHTTTYRYSEPARSNINELRLAPEESKRQKPGLLELKILPEAPLHTSRDLFGNLVHSFEVEEHHDELIIAASSIVDTSEAIQLVDRAFDIPLGDLKSLDQDDWNHQFIADSSLITKTPDIWREALDIHHFCDPTWGTLVQELSNSVFETCSYEEQFIHQMKTADDVQQDRTGTCQDFAHLLIGYCRSLGIPARYVSGYLYDPAVDSPGNSTVIGAGQSHAWVDIDVPGIGWIGIDPTNRKWVDESYVSLAFGRDYHDVAPVRGSLIGGGSKHSLDVSVKVTRAK